MDKRNFVPVRDNNLYQRGPNPNLRGLNTQFGDHFGIKNKIIENNKETFKKYDVIPDKGLVPKIINKPHKLVLRFLSGTTSGTSPINITLNEPFRDVVSVKLLSGFMTKDTTADGTTLTNQTSVNFITISIDELNNNYSSSTGDALLNSFATLDYDKTVTRDDTPADGNAEPNRHDIFKNNFGTHQDIRYFDPPLNSLTQLNIRVFTNNSTNNTTNNSGEEITNTTGAFACKLEFIVETKDKLRVY
tara:strand:+ start:235 stop:972 length:738 start_codon:yes stop_codon:yes gene_type:complete